MLYLEDYVELIEQLPQDLRDRFTDMRELDLKVQSKYGFAQVYMNSTCLSPGNGPPPP